MRLIERKDIKKVYFIGIGGVSMSALAKWMSVNGFSVSGSDGIRNEETEKLPFYGIKVFIGIDGERRELSEADLVVYTDAIPLEHKEFSRAKELAKPILSRAELLGEISQNFLHTIAVAGSHGKTTCTSMCAHIFKSLNTPFTAHIGGEDTQFGNLVTTGKEFLITEACEYKKNLLKLQPELSVLLNIDQDHMECYRNFEEICDTFRIYCQSAKTAFVCADDEFCQKIGEYPSFGINDPFADYRAVDLRASGERYSFTIEEYGKPISRIRLNAIGRCNVYNALASFAVARYYGFPEQEIARGLESFQAVKRRFEKIGTYRGVSFICDYAHHPREIRSTLRTAEGICRGKLYVVFQPHTYSRTKSLYREFVDVLQPLTNLMIYKTYPAREKYDEEGSAKILAEGVGCLYSENVHVLKTWIKKTVKEGDVVLFLGAGDIYYVAQYLLKEIK